MSTVTRFVVLAATALAMAGCTPDAPEPPPNTDPRAGLVETEYGWKICEGTTLVVGDYDPDYIPRPRRVKSTQPNSDECAIGGAR